MLHKAPLAVHAIPVANAVKRKEKRLPGLQAGPARTCRPTPIVELVECPDRPMVQYERRQIEGDCQPYRLGGRKPTIRLHDAGDIGAGGMLTAVDERATERGPLCQATTLLMTESAGIASCRNIARMTHQGSNIVVLP